MYKIQNTKIQVRQVICYSNELWLQSFFAVTLRLRGRSSRCSRECALSCDWLSVLTSLSGKQPLETVNILIGPNQHVHIHLFILFQICTGGKHLCLLLLHPPLFFCGGLSASRGNNSATIYYLCKDIVTLLTHLLGTNLMLYYIYMYMYICIRVNVSPTITETMFH